MRRAVVNAHRRPAGDRRLDQPYAASGGDGARRGHRIDWDDFSDLSVVGAAAGPDLSERQRGREPLPAAGGMAFLVRELLDAGLLHERVQTVEGKGLDAYAQEPWLRPDGARLAPGAHGER